MKNGFSLADILITITVVAIIAGVSLGFFKQLEPDKRIYDSTVRQLSRVVGAVNYRACSDDLVCSAVNANGNLDISTPTCPPFAAANDVTFANNQCIHAVDPASGNCLGGYTPSNGQCSIRPTCNGNPPTTYREVFCTNDTSNLGTRVNLYDETGAPAGNTSFLCSQIFDMLQNMNGATKITVCTSTAPIELSNRVRLYGLNGNLTNQPLILLIKYDSSSNPLYGDDDISSMSESTTGYVVVFPNGKIVSGKDVLAAGGDPQGLKLSTFKCGIVPTSNTETTNPCNGINATQAKGILTPTINNIMNVCGQDGSKCGSTANGNEFTFGNKAE